MEIKFKNFSRQELEKRKLLVEELLQEDIKGLELNYVNLEKAKEIKRKYNSVTADDWSMKPLEIVLANSDGIEIANIK